MALAVTNSQGAFVAGIIRRTGRRTSTSCFEARSSKLQTFGPGAEKGSRDVVAHSGHTRNMRSSQPLLAATSTTVASCVDRSEEQHRHALMRRTVSTARAPLPRRLKGGSSPSNAPRWRLSLGTAKREM